MAPAAATAGTAPSTAEEGATAAPVPPTSITPHAATAPTASATTTRPTTSSATALAGTSAQPGDGSQASPCDADSPQRDVPVEQPPVSPAAGSGLPDRAGTTTAAAAVPSSGSTPAVAAAGATRSSGSGSASDQQPSQPQPQGSEDGSTAAAPPQPPPPPKRMGSFRFGLRINTVSAQTQYPCNALSSFCLPSFLPACPSCRGCGCLALSRPWLPCLSCLLECSSYHCPAFP